MPDYFATWSRWILGGVAFALLGLFFAGVSLLTPECDSCREQLASLRTNSPYDEALTLYDHQGASLAVVGGEKRFTVPYDSIPALVRDAWVAIEDRRFRQHDGVDWLGVGRAVWANLSSGGVAEGASTIPMQVVRTVWTRETAEMSRWGRKVFEARMAPELVEVLGHDRVLDLYLNGLYMGEGVYGAGAAARHYFGRSLSELDLAEVATLVALGKTPARYNPREHPERARTRRDLVLASLARQGIITPQQRDSARALPVETLPTTPLNFTRSWATAAVRRELRQVAPDLVGRPGLRVFTTIDAAVQARADSLLRQHVAAIEAGERGARAHPDHPVQASLVALDSRSGEIRAVVGGRDFQESPLNRALQSRRQVGSLAKPLVYASALELGVSGARMVSTDEIALETREGVWAPRDHVEEARLLPAEVIIRSSNRGAVRMGQEVGADRFVDALARMGVDSDAQPYPSVFLGAFETSLVSITSAYAAFENGGRRVTPHLIRRVEDWDGTVLWERAPVVDEPLLQEASAFLVLSALRGVVDRGTGWQVRSALSPDRPAAGKTGTSNDGRDAWFVGAVPGMALGVWVGHDQPLAVTRGGSGSTLAAPLWGAVAAALPPADRDLLESGAWTPPPSVRAVEVDERGRVVLAGCDAAGPRQRVWVKNEHLADAVSACAPSLPRAGRGALGMELGRLRIPTATVGSDASGSGAPS